MAGKPSLNNSQGMIRRMRIDQARLVMKAAPSGDSVTNKVGGYLRWCVWGAKDHTTRNHSEICDSCWRQKGPK